MFESSAGTPNTEGVTMNKDLKALIAKLEAQGWTVKVGSHVKAYAADKANGLVTFACTPSDYRAMKNTLAELRRRGADV